MFSKTRFSIKSYLHTRHPVKVSVVPPPAGAAACRLPTTVTIYRTLRYTTGRLAAAGRPHQAPFTPLCGRLARRPPSAPPPPRGLPRRKTFTPKSRKRAFLRPRHIHFYHFLEKQGRYRSASRSRPSLFSPSVRSGGGGKIFSVLFNKRQEES
jgi:hypothetical protein